MKREIIRVEPLATYLEGYKAPTSTVSSSLTLISSSVPATGEGISVSTLSVLTSSSGSSASTCSPSSRRGRPGSSANTLSEEVLTELLSAPPEARPAVVHRARTLGVPIDGWHVAVRLDFAGLTDPQPDHELDAYRARVPRWVI